MIALGAQAFDGGDLLADGVADGSLAGPNGFAVDVDCAGATQAGAATEFRAGHLQLFADDPEQRRIARRLDGHIPSVDIEIRHFSLPLRCMMPLTAATHLWAKPRHPPGRCRDEAQNDRVPIWKQFKLESVEENKLAKDLLCVAAFPIRKSIATMRPKT